METFTIGAATITRVEESYEPNFDATMFFKEWRPDIVERHREWMLPHHYDAASGKLKLSIHSWLVQVGGRPISLRIAPGSLPISVCGKTTPTSMTRPTAGRRCRPWRRRGRRTARRSAWA